MEPAQPVEPSAPPAAVPAAVPPSEPPPAAPTAAAPPSAAPSSVAPARRSERSPRDMALSLLVLLVPIALLLGFYRVVLGGDQPVAADPGPAIEQARAAAAFPVAVPTGLADDWHVSRATFRRTADGATLRIGYLGPDGSPAQLLESSVPLDTLIPAELGAEVRPTGTFAAGSRTWRRFAARQGETALVLVEPVRTIIVVGATEPKSLESLAAALS